MGQGQEPKAVQLKAPVPLQDVPEHRSLEYPKLYEPGQLNLLFNKREFFICIAQGIFASTVMFFIPYGVFSDNTHLADYQSFAVTVATSLVIVVSVQVRATGLPGRLRLPPPKPAPLRSSSAGALVSRWGVLLHGGGTCASGWVGGWGS